MTPRAPSLALAWALLLGAPRVLAYDSQCYHPNGDSCPTKRDGLDAARQRWLGPGDEHRELWVQTRKAAGLPDAIDDPMVLRVWERWGGPELSDFTGDTSRAIGAAVALFAGLIHGAKQVIPICDDPMSAPMPGVNFLRDGTTQVPGLGDLFLPLLADPRFEPQQAALRGCGASAIRAVYARTAQLHGPMGGVDPAVEYRTVDSDDCWRQRATNEAMELGVGLHRGVTPNQKRIPHIDGSVAVIALTQVITSVSFTPREAVSLQRDFAKAMTAIKSWAGESKHTTEMAEGGRPDARLIVGGIQPNSSYRRSGGPPASYVEPSLPWTSGQVGVDGERREALALTFADAHAADRCASQSGADLDALRDAVRAADRKQADRYDAICGLCGQLTAPHLRFGVSADDYDTSREALCALVRGPTATLVYTGRPTPPEPFDYDQLQASAREVCGCTSNILFSRHNGNYNEVWAVAPDGSRPIQLTDGPGATYPVAMSADGTQAYFYDLRKSNGAPNRLYRIDLDGTGH